MNRESLENRLEEFAEAVAAMRARQSMCDSVGFPRGDAIMEDQKRAGL